jgi:alkanesulfonate monooxygenase SsuD/methylene tetrahydromethanopterin reductase-like flavin-dependent oxidoreductase (luciferase family)
MKHLFRGDGQEVDFDTRYYPAHKGIVGRPGSVQRPYPAIISAAFSPRGRDFAVRHSDFLMLGHLDADGNTKEIDDINARSAAVGRAEPPGIICSLAPFIRETREEAEAYFRDFAIDHADPVAIGNYFRLRDTNAARALVENDVRAVGAASGGNPVVGTPRDLVEALLRVRTQGYAGATFTLPHFTRDLPLIIEKAIPLMEVAGLRIRERSPAAASA